MVGYTIIFVNTVPLKGQCKFEFCSNEVIATLIQQRRVINVRNWSVINVGAVKEV